MSAQPAPTSSAADRGARRRERTRGKLLAAARRLFASQGIERTRIQEITDDADVGFGSFYNHFADKDDLVAAVLAEAVESQAQLLEGLAAGVEDPAEVMATAHRHFVGLAERDPEWAWLVVRAEPSHGALGRTLAPYALRDLQRGIDAGRFAVPEPALALQAMGGALLGVIRGVLDGHVGPDAAMHHAEGVLRMLGVAPEEAEAVARRSLPPADA